MTDKLDLDEEWRREQIAAGIPIVRKAWELLQLETQEQNDDEEVEAS